MILEESIGKNCFELEQIIAANVLDENLTKWIDFSKRRKFQILVWERTPGSSTPIEYNDSTTPANTQTECAWKLCESFCVVKSFWMILVDS